MHRFLRTIYLRDVFSLDQLIFLERLCQILQLPFESNLVTYGQVMLFINEVILFVQILDVIICPLYLFFYIKSLAIDFVALVSAFIADSLSVVDVLGDSLDI